MPSGGHNKKPTKLLQLEKGKVYASDHGDRSREPMPKGVPVMPKEFAGRAKECWEDVVPQLVELGLATAADQRGLEALCQSWADYNLHRESGDFNKSDRCLSQWRQLAREFGQTPAARAGLHVEKSRAESVMDQFAA